MKVDSLLVGGGEARFGGAVGVEAHMIETPLLQNFKDPAPTFDLHRGITSQGKRAALVGATKKDGEIVESDAHPRAGNLSQSKREFPCVLAVFRL